MSNNWFLLVAIIAALAGWGSFVFQRRSYLLLKEDFERQASAELQGWENAFVDYRRKHLRPLAEMGRKAYAKFVEGQSGHPSDWEEAVHAARWPRGLPLQEGQILSEWSQLGLDQEDRFLLRFAESIYSPVAPGDPRNPEERSILGPEDFREFDDSRGGVSDYFQLCGKLRRSSPDFAKFLEEHVRTNHYHKLKFAAYLELALVRAFTARGEVGAGKVAMFELGNDWKADDRRQ